MPEFLVNPESVKGDKRSVLIPKGKSLFIRQGDVGQPAFTPKDGKVTAEEIRQALVVRDPLVKNVVNRLLVKHHSEWSKGRSTGRWEGFYKYLDSLEVKYCEKWQADLEWMSRVPTFDKDEAIWHFHPVVFFDAIN